MGAEASAVGLISAWGTWEELILGGAVLRHGTRDWNVVASELRARTPHPHSFTPEVCKAKFEDLQKRYAGSTAWFEELKKQRVAELKRELARSEDSIGSLESKIKSLEVERQNSNQADYDSPQTESPLPVMNSEGTESVCKEASKDENSAGSFTKDTRITTNWLCQSQNHETETDMKPDVSVSSEQGKELSMEKLAEAGYRQGVTVRKRRSLRKRKYCHQAVKEGSVGESDNVGSSNCVLTAKRKDCNHAVKAESDNVRVSNCASTAKTNDCSRAVKEGSVGESDNVGSCKGLLTSKRKGVEEIDNAGSSNGASIAQKQASVTDNDQITRNLGNGVAPTAGEGHDLMDIFQSIASSKPAAVFRHRMDSQKRARYRKVVKQHLDICAIRSRIMGQSIKSVKELFRDLLLLANNALVFYSRRTREYKSALSLRNLVMKEYKQHCMETCKQAFLLPFSLPVKPRTARRRPLTRLLNGAWSSEKFPSPEKAGPVKEMPLCDSDSNVSVKVKKGVKRRPGKVKPELTDAQHRTTPLRQRKRVRK